MTMQSRILPALLASTLALYGVLLTAPTALAAAGTPPPFINGWVEVSSASQLEYIDQNPSSYLTDKIELMNNVTLTGTWVPLGTSVTNAFQGIFNGQGYTVSGVAITDATDPAVGFFGVSKGNIENVGVNVSISGNTQNYATIGGLVGSLQGGSVTNSFATGTLTSTGEGSYNGGLVGGLVQGSVADSYTSVAVTGGGASYNGGLVGLASSSLSNSYATGAVTGAGGSVNGGLVGDQQGANITDCYATGNVTGGAPQGGLIGQQIRGTNSNNYFDTTTTTQMVGVGAGSQTGVTGKPTAALQTESTYANWDFTNTWGMPTSGYPYLLWQAATNPVVITDRLPAVTQGTIYSATLQAFGGVAPYAWSAPSGSLPAGLSVSSGGVISGTATSPGPTSVTVTATDALHHTGQQILTLAVSGSPVAITTTSLPSAVQGSVYTTTLQASGGTSPYTWTAPANSLPAGLTLSSGGVITGMPTNVGSVSVTFTVTDNQDHTGQRTLSLRVNAPSNPPAPTWVPPVLTPTTVTVDGVTGTVIENMGYNPWQAIQGGMAIGYQEERAAIKAGATLSGEGADSSYLVALFDGSGVGSGHHVSAMQQGQFAALYQHLGIIPTWTDNTVTIPAAVSALLRAHASTLAIENYLVQLDGFSWPAAQTQAAAGFPIHYHQ